MEEELGGAKAAKSRGGYSILKAKGEEAREGSVRKGFQVK